MHTNLHPHSSANEKRGIGWLFSIATLILPEMGLFSSNGGQPAIVSDKKIHYQISISR
jgi:hypothetical protein